MEESLVEAALSRCTTPAGSGTVEMVVGLSEQSETPDGVPEAAVMKLLGVRNSSSAASSTTLSPIIETGCSGNMWGTSFATCTTAADSAAAFTADSSASWSAMSGSTSEDALINRLWNSADQGMSKRSREFPIFSSKTRDACTSSWKVLPCLPCSTLLSCERGASWNSPTVTNVSCGSSARNSKCCFHTAPASCEFGLMCISTGLVCRNLRL
mmetsp:Transcript_25615/g.48469  ORF Transcript_25615/g.48469 Transcript_25615/m.48469 type:complete len:212 (+) Transcript_25615:496-1131(+)